jgi:hypothetical protein
MYVVVTGNPFDGLSLWGPFNDANEAGDWASIEMDGETWWVMAINPTEAEEL